MFKKPHEILLKIANGSKIMTEHGEVFPSVRDRIQAATACAPYYAQKLLEKKESEKKKFKETILDYYKEIITRLPP